MRNMGWIKLHREILDHWIFDDPIKFHRWVSLLLLARHDSKPAKVNMGNNLVTCERGQIIMSLKTISNMWNCSRSSAKHFLELLQKDNMITLQSQSICTQITICNYDSYQSSTNTCETLGKQLENNPETLSATNNNGNKEIINTDVPAAVEFSEIPKTINTELKEKEKSSAKKEKEKIDFTGIVNSMVENKEMKQSTANSILEWVEYKKQKKTLYTTELGFRKFIASLRTMSVENKKTPAELIDHAISKEWDGIHKITEMQPQKKQEEPNKEKLVYADASEIPEDLRRMWGMQK